MFWGHVSTTRLGFPPKRSHTTRPVLFRVSVANFVSARQRRLGPLPQLVNISGGSLIVKTDELLQRGQAVLVTIHFADSSQEVQIETEVVWANPRLGDMALRFVTLGEGGAELIANYLTLLCHT